MSKTLSRLLGRSEEEIAAAVSKLEASFGYPSHDVRLLVEVNQAVRDKIASLGLDPKDTTEQELYHALLAKFAATAGQVDKALGLKIDSDFDSRLSRAIGVAKLLTGNAQVWALKPSAAKNLLHSLPPKKLMGQLHYRSSISMLKHENIGELYLLAPYAESNTWQNELSKTAARLASNNYGLYPVNFVHLRAARCHNFIEPTGLNVYNKLTGSAGLWPSKKLTNAPVITMVLMLLQSVTELGASIDKKALAAVHPALQWWNNNDYLVSAPAGRPVSLNVNDVAHNHLNSASHENSAAQHGAKELWAELAGRYQSLASEMQQAAENEVEKLMPAALAAQYQEA